MELSNTCSIPDEELTFEFMRSTGPGGQHVNKTESAVRLIFNVEANQSLPEEVKNRLYKIAANRISNSGILTIVARTSRRQLKNKQEALEKLRQLILQASKQPKPSIKTSIPLRSKIERRESKKRRSMLKSLRRSLDAGER